MCCCYEAPKSSQGGVWGGWMGQQNVCLQHGPFLLNFENFVKLLTVRRSVFHCPCCIQANIKEGDGHVNFMMPTTYSI